ncbi:MAG TPA: hypothetical protein PLA25_11450, partial [Anaerolineaceae bacterium]|nr:hypothetical protein [Anaerolineaceae bacterium]
LWKHKVLYLLGLVSSLVLVDLNALLIMLVCISPSEFNLRWSRFFDKKEAKRSVENAFLNSLRFGGPVNDDTIDPLVRRIGQRWRPT